MKNRANRLHNIKVWNIILIVLTVFSVLYDLMGISSTLNPKLKQFDFLKGDFYKNFEITITPQQMFEHASKFPVKLVYVVGLVLSFVLLFLYFRNHQRIKQTLVPLKFPYLLFIGWQVIANLFEMFYDPVNITVINGSGLSIRLITFLLYSLIPLLILNHIYRIEKEEKVTVSR